MASSKTIPVIGIERLRFGLDGEGIRTLIGTAGCPLRCSYCLNPHSWDGSAPVAFYTPEQLFREVAVHDLYYRATGGGVTFGGGEPLLHVQALAKFKELCPDSWSLWAETSLQVPAEQVTLAAKIFDHFLIDIKSIDYEIYRRYTGGGDISLVLENLRLLLALLGPERITVRLPLIPGFVMANDRRASAETLQAMGIRNIDYLQYSQEI